MFGDLLICAFPLVGLVLLTSALVWITRRHAWSRPARLLAGNLLILGMLLCAFLAAGELYFRFIYDKPDPFGVTRASRRWFDRHFKYNRMGFRDDVEYALTRLPGRRRVTFAGDSFTAGHGIDDVEDRMVNRVRKAIPGADIHSFAQIGFDTPQEASLIEQLASAGYEYDQVVLVFCLNDVASLMPEYGEACSRIYSTQETEGFLVQHSYFINAVYYRVTVGRLAEVKDYYSFVRQAYSSDVWQREQAALLQMRDFIASRRGRLAVAVYPFFHLLESKPYPYEEAHIRLQKFCASNDVPFLDLMETYNGMKPRDLIVSGFDAHPNERANELAANAVIPFVESLFGSSQP